jgi:tetratricopeptide (TPR) repeat protein
MMLIWDQTAVSFSIKQDVDTKIMGQIDNLMNADNRPYFNAAMYYMDNGKDLTKASLWFDKAIELTPNAFWMWHQKAKCLALQGKKADAKAAALKSIDLAKAAQNSDYVALNEKLIAGLK